MCSGARSSSANGAMAARAAPASSWSTSSSTVLSDCTINGPSLNGATPPHRSFLALYRRRRASSACVHYSVVDRHHRCDAVDGEIADPPGRGIVGPQLAALDDDRRYHPL